MSLQISSAEGLSPETSLREVRMGSAQSKSQIIFDYYTSSPKPLKILIYYTLVIAINKSFAKACEN